VPAADDQPVSRRAFDYERAIADAAREEVARYRAENERLREVLSSALGYLSGDDDEQARRICEIGCEVLRS
jgi:hypothetical protein